MDSGREVGVGEVGELWLAGPNIMQGYLSRPEATASTIDADGCADGICTCITFAFTFWTFTFA